MIVKNLPKVSVIVTTYNAEKTIEATILSIENQIGKNELFEIEIIVVDDCSSDRTLEVLNEKSIILISNEKNSGGPNKGRNTGLQRCTGDYICIADHDDIWNEDRLMKQIPFLKTVPIVTSGYVLIDELKKKKIFRVNESREAGGYNYYGVNQTFLARLVRSNKGQITYPGSIIFRSELKSVLFEELFGQVDSDWILRIFHGRDSMEVCEPLYCRYVEGSNLSLNRRYRRNDFYYSLMEVEGYEDTYPKEVRKAFCRIHGSRARYYYFIGEMKKARFYFLKSEFNLKTALYILTTYFGSRFVKDHFNVFG